MGRGNEREPEPWPIEALDDDFISAAPITERSADDRARAAERQRRSEALQRRIAVEASIEEGFQRSQRRRRLARRLGWSVALVAIAGSIAWVSRAERGSSRTVIGADGLVHIEVADPNRPTPSPSASTHPLGVPAPLPTQRGPFTFMHDQPGSASPVAYDPCRPIHYVVNSADAPPGASQLLAQAIQRVHTATGLEFVDDGATTEPAAQNRLPFEPTRYGDKWAPVVIWWTSPSQMPVLAGDVAGEGGSTWTQASADSPTEVYVTGFVALDGPQLAQIMSEPDGHDRAKAVILHELGHLVGLAHVHDPTQIMNPVNEPGTTDYAAGDLDGLHQLGSGACVPSL